VASWRIDGRKIEITPFAPISTEARSLLAAEGDALLRYLDAGPPRPPA
jgi:hypothetical protein